MLDLLTSLISGGNGLIAALATIFGLVTAAYFKGRSAEKTKQKAKEADALKNHQRNVANANNARNSVHADDSVQSDPYRRD